MEELASFVIIRNPNQAQLPEPFVGSWSREVEISFYAWDAKAALAMVFVGGQKSAHPVIISKHEVPRDIVQAARMFPRWFDTGNWF